MQQGYTNTNRYLSIITVGLASLLDYHGYSTTIALASLLA